VQFFRRAEAFITAVTGVVPREDEHQYLRGARWGVCPQLTNVPRRRRSTVHRTDECAGGPAPASARRV
jgi:hypothetical protein